MTGESGRAQRPDPTPHPPGSHAEAPRVPARVQGPSLASVSRRWRLLLARGGHNPKPDGSVNTAALEHDPELLPDGGDRAGMWYCARLSPAHLLTEHRWDRHQDPHAILRIPHVHRNTSKEAVGALLDRVHADSYSALLEAGAADRRTRLRTAERSWGTR